ncbi:MAG: mannose-1-phosphate guanylyltransferase [Spirochaetia bacterium]|nr:mannose-1-phosphate guanylyltransferase [Spirochaetia bacterium]
MKPKIYILAGGAGTRLRPLSQTGKGQFPKQFLKLVGDTALLQEAIDRIPADMDVGIIPEKRYTEEVYRQAAEIGRRVNVLEEPFGCNTAAAILYAALFEHKALHNTERVLCFLPADHKMDKDVFRDLLDHAINVAAETGQVVTIGIKPDRAETNYGYIQAGNHMEGTLATYQVKGFVEKPDKDTAEVYLRDGNYFWNAGIFIARTSVLIEAAEKHCPEILRPISEAVMMKSAVTIADAYRKIKESGWNISIDYALMERIASQMTLIPAPKELAWNDLGNWESLNNYLETDTMGNTFFPGNPGEFNESSNVMLCNYTTIPVRVENCSDILVVATENGILIRKKEVDL